MDRVPPVQFLPIQWAATVLMSSPFLQQLLKLHLPFPHIGGNNCFKWQAEPSIMRMLARPPVAVTPVLHRGDSWKQALKLPSLTPFHVLSHQNHSIFKALRESVTNWKSNTLKLTNLWVTPHWNTRWYVQLAMIGEDWPRFVDKKTSVSQYSVLSFLFDTELYWTEEPTSQCVLDH